MNKRHVELGKATILRELLRTKDAEALAPIAEYLAKLALEEGPLGSKTREVVYFFLTSCQNKIQLTMYTVYNSPSDYPGKWVVRVWQNEQPLLEPLCVEETLIDARSKLPPGLNNVGRFYSDDPVVHEVWI